MQQALQRRLHLQSRTTMQTDILEHTEDYGY